MLETSRNVTRKTDIIEIIRMLSRNMYMWCAKHTYT